MVAGVVEMSKGEGWGWPGNARKAHYFDAGISLCGKWMHFGDPENHSQKTGDEPGRDDCRACWRAAQKRSSDAG